MSNKIIIGSRGSKLSLAYSNKVKSLILKNNPPSLVIFFLKLMFRFLLDLLLSLHLVNI